MTDRRGDWMQTYNGVAFYPLDPRPEDIWATDIAHALSMLCRYGGHTSRFYSVAEHCVLMADAVPPGHALWALLHDATEAYLGDMIRPLKRALPDYVEAEDRVMDAICKRYGLTPQMPQIVKEADNRILQDERAVLLSAPPLPWSSVENVPALGVTINGWPPDVARREYLRRLHALMRKDACRNCRRPIYWEDGIGWLHGELPQYAHEDITCGIAHPVGCRHRWDAQCPREWALP